MLTNAFVPCNGRFPTLIALISMFLVLGGSAMLSAALLTGFILIGVLLSFVLTRILTASLLRGEDSSFVLELPPYRMPKIGQLLIHSVKDRALFVLGRAAAVAAPAGALLWILANTAVGGQSLLLHLSAFLDPLGRFMGMDGVILTGFLLGLPANEIVLPVIMMIYSAGGSLTDLGGLSQMGEFLRSQGWTELTALCVMLFMLCHPCSTTLWSIKKESGSMKMLLLSWFIPTVTGLILCATLRALFQG